MNNAATREKDRCYRDSSVVARKKSLDYDSPQASKGEGSSLPEHHLSTLLYVSEVHDGFDLNGLGLQILMLDFMYTGAHDPEKFNL